jgi:hypothetical protein
VRFVPQERDRLLGDVLNRPKSIVIAVRTWKDDDAKFHGYPQVDGI